MTLDLSTFETFPNPMRAMSLWQPWATLVAEGIKSIETRPKQHPWRSAIGKTVAVHAAKQSIDVNDMMRLPRKDEARFVYDNRWYYMRGENAATMSLVPLGAIIATCRIANVVPMLGDCGTDMGQPTHVCGAHSDAYLLLHLPEWDPLGETEFDVSAQRPYGHFAEGRWAILLDQIVKLAEPIPCRGHQGLWSLPADVEEQIVAQRAA